MEKQRADVALCLAGLCESRSKARALIKEGAVLVDGKAVEKPSQLIGEDEQLSLTEAASADVSRAGQKLRAALSAFDIDPKGMVFADIGASTGGFTQCLLEGGALKVYAVDVGRDQLHKSLKTDARVVNMEGTNARELDASDFADAIDGAVMDVSFISQTLIYPALFRILKSGAPLITLVKPQFEVGRENVGKNGIVKDKNGSLLAAVLLKLKLAAEDNGFSLVKTVPSPIKGSKGNTEHLALFYKQ
ncbi:MAG: TlyA family RNA methyltransferase [Ruminococcaceae bacterium]|nr:TlyA family RNA methyltransferase [Oscillospiraceae bacterium]